MQANRTFYEELKYQYRYGGITTQLIYVNVLIFLLTQIILAISRLTYSNIDYYLYYSFYINTELDKFVYAPFTLFTSIFAHASIFHLLENMLFLYFSGKMFEMVFDKKRLLYLYILGGITGGLLELLAHSILPAFELEKGQMVVGASGSIMAIFIALAFYRPNLEVRFFGVFPVKLIFLALFFILINIVTLGIADKIAHFAHLGGALFGALSIIGISNKKDIITHSQMFTARIKEFFKSLFKRNSHLKVKKGGGTRSTQFKSDEEYNLESKQRQEKIDAILDKIAKSGYESLTKAEKDFLFNQSKK